MSESEPTLYSVSKTEEVWRKFANSNVAMVWLAVDTMCERLTRTQLEEVKRIFVKVRRERINKGKYLSEGGDPATAALGFALTHLRHLAKVNGPDCTETTQMDWFRWNH